MIPDRVIELATKHAQLMHCVVLVYKYHDTYLTVPIGYEIKTDATLLGYVTKDLVFCDETTKNLGNASN